MNDATITYSITDAANKLAISAKTLRRWEETGRFQPQRTEGNQRRYTTEDIQILDAIAHDIIPSDQELLTLDQAANLAAVSATTIKEWENNGRLRTFITSVNSYYLKTQLKQVILEQAVAEPQEIPKESYPMPLVSSDPIKNKLTPLSQLAPTTPPSPIRHDLKLALLNILITTTLLAGYHFLTFTQPDSNTPSQVIGSVQGISTSTDPKLEVIKTLIDSTGNLNTAGSVRVGGQLITPRFTLSPTTRPSSPVAGNIYFDAGSQTLELYDGKNWIILTPATAVVPSPSPKASSTTKLTPVSQTLR